MTNKLLELSHAAFDAVFPLLPNHFDSNAAWTVDDGPGCLFATHGPELDYVLAQDPATVWTFLDGDDGGQFVVSGLRWVNRIGYLVSAAPRPPGIDVLVRISSAVDGECA